MPEHSGLILATKGELKVIDCLDCGYAHLDPLPSASEVDVLYLNDNFYAEGGKAWFEKERKEHVAGLWDAEYSLRERLLGSSWLWDIGCGAGWFASWWEFHCDWARGYEPSLIAKEHSPFKDYIFGDWNDAYYEVNKHAFGMSQKFSLCFSLTLEHLLNPKDEIMDWLAMTGASKVLVKVPNEFNPLQNKLVKRLGKTWFVTKEHINYFTPQGLRNLLRQSGLTVTWEGATFPMELFALMGFNYIGNDKLGQKCHKIRLQFEKRLGVKAFEFYRLLYQKLGWGRELIFLAERK